MVCALTAVIAFGAPRPVAAIPEVEYVGGFGTVTWSFSGEPEQQREISCGSDGSGPDDCDLILEVLNNEERLRLDDCGVDRTSTGVARLVVELDGKAFDRSFDRAVDCDRWTWDGYLANVLPLPPHLNVPDLPPTFERHVVGRVFVGGEPIAEGAPLVGQIKPDSVDLWFGFCGLSELPPIRVDGDSQWERPLTPYSEATCDARVGAGAPHLQELFTTRVLDVAISPTSFSLSAGDVELLIEPIPRDNIRPELSDVFVDDAAQVVRWTATDEDSSVLWVCVHVTNLDLKCEVSTGSMPVVLDQDVPLRVTVSVVDEYGAERRATIENANSISQPSTLVDETPIETRLPAGVRLGVLATIVVAIALFVRRMRTGAAAST